ncbi:MAG: hypothetical protein H8E81_10160 [Deltaproteobacteria bacterium]|nr:hypothetical protein [Deltaproteobacteria bacterium]
MGKDEETEIVIQGLPSDFLKTNEIKLQSEATSLFDVQRWTFDVRRSSLETSPYGINATCEHLQNNLALMGSSSGDPLCRRIRQQF